VPVPVPTTPDPLHSPATTENGPVGVGSLGITQSTDTINGASSQELDTEAEGTLLKQEVGIKRGGGGVETE
jgi:hypothetical protein